ncbi:MAG: DEAD/DEAH box helicase [Thermoanaerobaculia bacterium]
MKPVSLSNVVIGGALQSDAAPLGKLNRARPVHNLEERIPHFDRGTFAVQPAEIEALYTELRREDTPVVIAVAPTGSGKSTFLTYRLACPENLQPDTFTRGRQIVITQPRRKAAVSTPGYVAGTLHGADWGIGHEIGYRVKGQHACDWRNRLTYVTEGTLINWLVRGELDRISMVIIDEAHERSLNIDVILGLLTRALPQFPHLKMLIVSATIDHQYFQRHFDRRLPKGLRCGIVVCSGTKPKGLAVHYRSDASGQLPYAPGALKEFSRNVSKELADAVLRLLLSMDGPPELADPAIEPGDILGFLHGKKEIRAACELIEQHLASHHPQLAARTDVYPYHAEVDSDVATKATEKKPDPSRRRVVIASNAAETSLTIVGLVHVVESGFIKQKQWDPVLEQAPLLPVVHSQAGCRQRWGRAGRVAEGWAWCLYTKSQFATIFPSAGVPEIQRSSLDGVVLKAKRGGADRIEEKSFPWLDAPAADEIARTLVRLQRQRLLDSDGDLTDAGVLAAMASEEDTLYNRLMSDGDRFGFGIEVSTLVPFLERGMKNLLPDDKEWDDDTRRGVREAQKRVRASCSDDLELCLRLYSQWRYPVLPPDAPWTPPRLDRKDAGQRDGAALLQELKSARDEQQVARSIEKHVGNPAIRQRYLERALGAFRDTARSLWARIHGIDAEVLEVVNDKRTRLIEEIGAKKKGMEDRPIDFAGLERLRAIIARAFVDQVHVRVPFEPGGTQAARYSALVPSPKETPVEIAAVSNCAANPPDTFVALGPKESITTKTERESIRLAPFAVRVNLTTVEAVRDRDDLEMAEYMRTVLPRPAQGSAEDARLRQHERLRKGYPIGVIVECRAVADMRDVGDVSVLRIVGWGGGPPLRFGSSEAWQELREYEHNRSFDPTDLRPATGSRTRGQLILEEEFDLISEELEKQASVQRAATGSSEASIARGRLQCFGATRLAAGQTARAEVTRYSEITGEPSLILVSPPVRERFSEFMKTARMGDEIDTEVIGPSPRGAFDRGLQVRDLKTGLELVLPTEEVFLFRDDCFLGDIEPGARIRIRIEHLDQRTRTVHATALNALEPELIHLHTGAGGATITGILRSIQATDRDVYMVAVVPSRRAAGPPVPVKIVMPRERFEGASGFLIPYRLGQKVTLKTRADSSHEVSCGAQLSPPEQAALASVGIQAAAKGLSCRGRLTFDARTSALRSARSPELVAAVRALFARSNLLYANVVTPEIVGKTVEGRIQKCTPHRVEAVLPGGILGILESPEASWFADRPRLDQMFVVEQVIRAVVLRISDGGQPLLSTKRARSTQDPWTGGGIVTLYPVGTPLVCRIANAISSRAWAEIEPGLQGSAHVKDLRALSGGSFITDARTVATPGRWVNARVLGHDAVKKQLNLQILGWAANPSTETLPRPAAATAPTPPTQTHVGWLNGPWPWDAGENAIPKEVVPSKPPPPKPARPRPPLDQRSKPSGWHILL